MLFDKHLSDKKFSLNTSLISKLYLIIKNLKNYQNCRKNKNF